MFVVINTLVFIIIIVVITGVPIVIISIIIMIVLWDRRAIFSSPFYEKE